MPVMAATPTAAHGHGPSSQQRHRPPSTSQSTERIYSAKQLGEALRSGLAAIKDQLQVLAILDGTATSWPGVTQAIDDMEFLTDMSMQTSVKLEKDGARMGNELAEVRRDAAALRDSLAAAQAARDELQRDLNQAHKDLKSTHSQLDQTSSELQAQRQECWALEKQRADLATELDKARQDLDYQQQELAGLRAATTDQAATISTLKEDLAARRSDVQHLGASVAELKQAAAQAKQALGSAQQGLAATQAALQHERSEKQHYEREAQRLAEEASRLGAELDKLSKESQRLKEWQDVLKKVEGDKLRDEQAAHARTRSEADARLAEAEHHAVALRGEVAAREERLAGREGELEAQRKANTILQLQVKEAQKQLALAQSERANIAKARDEQRALAAKLQAALNAARLEAEKRDKERAVGEGRAREEQMGEKAKLKAQLDEAVKDAAVCRAVADGWQRDLKQLAAKLAAEGARADALAAQLEASKTAAAAGTIEATRASAAGEAQLQGLRAQLAAKDEEVRRAKFEASSHQMKLEKTIERLQREVDASAAEIERLKAHQAGSDSAAALFTRLPAMARAATVSQELDALRRAIQAGMFPGSGQAPGGRLAPMSSLPALNGGGQVQARSAAPLAAGPPERPSHLRHQTR